jgi:hypothetical protein
MSRSDFLSTLSVVREASMRNVTTFIGVLLGLVLITSHASAKLVRPIKQYDTSVSGSISVEQVDGKRIYYLKDRTNNWTYTLGSRNGELNEEFVRILESAFERNMPVTIKGELSIWKDRVLSLDIREVEYLEASSMKDTSFTQLGGPDDTSGQAFSPGQLLPGLGGERSPNAQGTIGKWTFMVYMDGDNDLERFVVKDIERELAFFSKDVHIVVLADRIPRYDKSRGNWTGTLLFVTRSGITATVADAVEDWGEANMGDPRTLERFITWSKINYPADRYALFFWDHGWTWRPYQSIWDQTSDDTLDPDEILSVMERVGPVDVVAFDGCEQADIEVQAQWRRHASVFVGSQDDMGWDGIEYERVLPSLLADPSMSPEELGLLLAQSMTRHTDGVTASMTVLNEDWDILLAAVDMWAKALLHKLPKYRSEYDLAWHRTVGMADPLNKDLGDAARKILETVPDSLIRARSQAVIDALSRTIAYEWHVDNPEYQGVSGLTIFWPLTLSDLDEPSSPQNDFSYYRHKLLFSAMTHWDEFLKSYTRRERSTEVTQ